MPSDPTAEQTELHRKGRQRLIGAVALALAAVVFVPMLLDPEPRQERVEPLLAIPPKDGAPPLAVATKGPVPAVAADAAKAAPAEGSVPVSTPRQEPAPPSAPKAAAPKPEPKPVPAPKLEGFAVQVGAFRDEAKLAQAREKVAAARLAHYTERLGSPSGELTRLRAGPFPTRDAAEKAAAQLKRSGLDVRVVPLP